MSLITPAITHSPLPWSDDGFSLKDSAGKGVTIYGFAGAEKENQANRRLIIRAVNSHDRLLAAAKRANKVFL